MKKQTMLAHSLQKIKRDGEHHEEDCKIFEMGFHYHRIVEVVF